MMVCTRLGGAIAACTAVVELDPLPMRFGPPPNTMTFFRSVAPPSSSYVEYMLLRVRNFGAGVDSSEPADTGARGSLSPP
jgi:hypothetical protein